MDLSVLRYEERDSVAVIEMCHPPVNALGVAFLADFEAVLAHLATSDVRAVVLTSGCPGFFSAGDDVGALRELDPSLLDKLPRAHAVLDAFETLPLPTVAAINGQALGGGLELALVCDFRFMGDAAGRIGLPEVRLGMIPALGGTQRLPALVGRGVAIEMMYKGLQLTPADAKSIGLIHDVFPQAEVVDRCVDYAIRLARQATAAIARIKHCVLVGQREGRAAGMAAERAAFRDNITSHDAREGVAAFLDGRKPAFTGES
jgi:enoyl-CoA hydratase/carnithine racemase